MDMDANLKVQDSWKNSDLYHTLLNTAKACEELSPNCYNFATILLGGKYARIFSSIQRL
jgi:hypothetical protein